MNTAIVNYETGEILERTRRSIDIVKRSVSEGCDRIRNDAKVSAEAYFRTLIDKIPGWISNYSSYQKIDNLFVLRRQATEMTGDLVHGVQRKIEDETSRWCEKEFTPLVAGEIDSLGQSLMLDLGVCRKDLDSLKVSAGKIDTRGVVEATTPGLGERILSSGGAILCGDLVGAIMGGLGGVSACLKTIAAEISAALILGIISLFNPVSLAALVVATIVSGFVGGRWALVDVEKNIKEKVTDEMVNKFGQASGTFPDNALSAVNKYLDKIVENVSNLCAQYELEASRY